MLTCTTTAAFVPNPPSCLAAQNLSHPPSHLNLTFSPISGMTALLHTLEQEVSKLYDSGKKLQGIVNSTDSFLLELKAMESSLEQEMDINVDEWYKNSISNLKGYNTQLNRFQKNILTNPKYNVSLDESYTFPLNLSTIPINNSNDIYKENQEELMKAITLHLLKIGQSDLIKDILQDMNINVDENLLSRFQLLNQIVDDIVLNHDLSKALDWLSFNSNKTTYEEIEFKLHITQFTLLLNGEGKPLDNALEAYLYSKQHFPKFFNNYLEEISPLMTLLLFKTLEVKDDSKNPVVSLRNYTGFQFTEFMLKMRNTFVVKDKLGPKYNESRFVEQVLQNFDNIGEFQTLFQTLATEFISYYCKEMNLSNDSSLYQSILAGFINLPNFYKYSHIQRKFSKVLEDSEQPSNLVAPFSFDLPFQLPDSNRFLFKYHPIFICPVTKEQLIPLTIEERSLNLQPKRPKLEQSKEEELVVAMNNPVVVLKYCNHVTLKESVWQLSKKGTEVFRCHYCYKKHKFSEVSEAFFVDL